MVFLSDGSYIRLNVSERLADYDMEKYLKMRWTFIEVSRVIFLLSAGVLGYHRDDFPFVQSYRWHVFLPFLLFLFQGFFLSSIWSIIWKISYVQLVSSWCIPIYGFGFCLIKRERHHRASILTWRSIYGKSATSSMVMQSLLNFPHLS